MTPIQLLAHGIRQAITEGTVTHASVDNMRQLARQVLADDTLTATEIRERIAWALSDPPDARSFATDSGIGASRAFGSHNARR